MTLSAQGNVLVPDILASGVRRWPHRPCVIEGNRVRSFEEAHERAWQFADALREIGAGPGDRVAILCENELEFTELQVGINRAGAVAVPVNPRLAAPEIERLLLHSGAGLLVHGPGQREKAEGVSVPAWHLGDSGAGESYEERLGTTRSHTAPPMFARGEICSIIYTSGTTGAPKGVAISYGTRHARFCTLAIEQEARRDSVYLQTLPISSAVGNVGWSFTYIGATAVQCQAFDPAETLDVVARHRVSNTLLVPTKLNALCGEWSAAAHDVSSMRFLLYGSAPIAPDVLVRALEVFGPVMAQGYGMTETQITTTLSAVDHDPVGKPHLLTSAGKDVVGAETRVVDPEGREVAEGVTGEVICRGALLFDGYFNDPEATSSAVRDGWLWTGDLGYRSEDGYLYLVDRAKDMIVSGGSNVYSREVEDALYDDPDVYEAAVIGVPHEYWGEVVHAVVVPAAGRTLTSDGVMDRCRMQIAGFKVPKSIEFVSALPKNASGKIDKQALRAAYWESCSREIA